MKNVEKTYKFEELSSGIKSMMIDEELRIIRDEWLVVNYLDELFFVQQGFEISDVELIDYCIDCDEKSSFAKYPGFTEEENNRLLSVIWREFSDAINPVYFSPNNRFHMYVFDKNGNVLNH